MSVSGLWISSFCAVVLVGLAGCGASSNNTSPVQGGAGGGTSASTAVTYTFTGAAPTAVATRIGTGAFTQASLQSSKLTLSIPSGTTNYSVAWVCPTVTSFHSPPANGEHVAQASTLDGTSFIENCFDSTAPPQGLATLSVNASAVVGAYQVAISQWIRTVTPDWSATRSLSGSMPSGTYDVFVVVYEQTGAYPLAVKILRSQTIPGALNGGNTLVFGPSDLTVPQTLTYKNVPAGFSVNNMAVYYTTAGGQELTFSESIPWTTSYAALPVGTVQSGDYYGISAGEGYSPNPIGSNVEIVTASGGPQTMTFPSLSCSCPAPSAAAFPTLDFSYTGFFGMPSVSLIASIDWGLGITPTHLYATSTASIGVTSTENYQHGATTLTIPDLTGLPGFLAVAPSGTSVQWFKTVEQLSISHAVPPTGSAQWVWFGGTYIEP